MGLIGECSQTPDFRRGIGPVLLRFAKSNDEPENLNILLKSSSMVFLSLCKRIDREQNSYGGSAFVRFDSSKLRKRRLISPLKGLKDSAGVTTAICFLSCSSWQHPLE